MPSECVSDPRNHGSMDTARHSLVDEYLISPEDATSSSLRRFQAKSNFEPTREKIVSKLGAPLQISAPAGWPVRIDEKSRKSIDLEGGPGNFRKFSKILEAKP